MKVYVLNEWMDYSGNVVRGVFSTLEKAQDNKIVTEANVHPWGREKANACGRFWIAKTKGDNGMGLSIEEYVVDVSCLSGDPQS